MTGAFWRGVGPFLVLAVGCSSSPASNLEPDGGAPIAETVQATSTVAELNGGAPIAGARICIVDHPEITCAVSGDDGSYTISMPAWTTEIDLAYNVSAPGHLGDTELVHEKPGSVQWGPLPLYLYDDAAAADLLNQAGFGYPTGGKGVVLFWAPQSSGTISSSPVGAGPVYVDLAGTPDPSLTGVTSNSYGLFGDLEPGPVELTTSDPSCVPAVFPVETWADANPRTIAGVTVADSITRMDLLCGG